MDTVGLYSIASLKSNNTNSCKNIMPNCILVHLQQTKRQTNTGSYNCQSITRVYHNKLINSQQYKAFVTWDKTTI